MILPLYITFTLLLQSFPLETSGRVSKGLSYIVIVFIAVCFFMGSTPSWYNNSPGNIKHEGRIAVRGRHVGEILNEFFNAYQFPSIGVISAGGIKYAYQGEVIDLMGLNNVSIAHSSGNRRGVRNHAAFSKEVFYLMAPHVVFPRVFEKAPTTLPYNKVWHNAVLKGLLDDTMFNAQYTCASIEKLNIPESAYLLGYFRNDYLEWLEGIDFFKVSLLDGKKTIFTASKKM